MVLISIPATRNTDHLIAGIVTAALEMVVGIAIVTMVTRQVDVTVRNTGIALRIGDTNRIDQATG